MKYNSKLLFVLHFLVKSFDITAYYIWLFVSHFFIIWGICLLVFSVLRIILCRRVWLFWNNGKATPKNESDECHKCSNQKNEIFNCRLFSQKYWVHKIDKVIKRSHDAVKQTPSWCRFQKNISQLDCLLLPCYKLASRLP